MSKTTKQLTISLIGTVTYGATRSFVIEVPDEVNPATLDPHLLEDPADKAHIAWAFESEGFVQMTDHVIEEVLLAVKDCHYPVIPCTTSHVQGEAIA